MNSNLKLMKSVRCLRVITKWTLKSAFYVAVNVYIVYSRTLQRARKPPLVIDEIWVPYGEEKITI